MAARCATPSASISQTRHPARSCAPPEYSDRGAIARSGTSGRSSLPCSRTRLLRIKERLNRVKDQLAVPEIEALIEIRDLERGSN